MPRAGRVDAPGAVHHIIGRGIERREIFRSVADSRHFVGQLGKVLTAGGARCLAWALMPNHYHLVVRTGKSPLAKLMMQLLTSYALGFNRRHVRSGHLFQNRYKSILCEVEPYLLELVRYIHLNPLRGGLVADLDELETFPWSGHGVLLGTRKVAWQETTDVLEQFGPTLASARVAYRTFVAEGVDKPIPEEFEGARAIRRVAGQWEYVTAKPGKGSVDAEQVLVERPLLQMAMAGEEESEARRSRLIRAGWTPARIIAHAAAVCGVDGDHVYGNGKRPPQVRARALACKWMVEDLGMSGAKTSRILRISQPTVSQNVERGRRIASAFGRRLEDLESRRRIQ